MSFVLREKPREEDLEVVTHWVDSRGRHWPTNSDNVPLHPDGKPFEMDDTGEHYVPVKEGDTPIRLRFWLKMLTGPESNAITEAILKMRTKTRRSRRGQSEVETDVSIALAAQLKLKAGLVKWEGITLENGKPTPLNERNIALLPAWLHDDLVDGVTALTTITEEEEGE